MSNIQEIDTELRQVLEQFASSTGRACGDLSCISGCFDGYLAREILLRGAIMDEDGDWGMLVLRAQSPRLSQCGDQRVNTARKQLVALLAR